MNVLLSVVCIFVYLIICFMIEKYVFFKFPKTAWVLVGITFVIMFLFVLELNP